MNQIEERKARLKATAEKLKKQRQEEAEKDRLYFEKLTSGTRWKLFGTFSILCVILAILLTFDTFKDGKVYQLTTNQYRFDRSLGSWGNQSVWVNEEDIFLIPFEELFDFDENSFQLTTSPIFGDPKYLSFKKKETTGDSTRYYFQKRISIYEWFPLVQLMLLIPLFVFLFKRQKPWFKFAQFTCFFLIFPGSIILVLRLLF